MRGLLSAVALAVFAGLAWFWWSGGFDQLARLAASEQRAFQNEIAGSLRGLRAGQSGAFWVLMGVSFAYGFFHAVGPGHGKVLIGGYGVARKVAALRLSVIGFLASMGQAVTAIILVYSGVWLFNLTRQTMVGVTEAVMAPVSFAAIAAIGAWLMWRGVAKLRRMRGVDHVHAHDHTNGHGHGHGQGHVHGDHDHAHDGACSECGHRHAPSLEEVSQINGLREAFGLIAGIAIRPCTGALFVLIITWQMGIGWAGVAAAFAMALGTAAVTVGVGLTAVGLRGGMLGGLTDSGISTKIVPIVEMVAGSVITVIAVGLLLRAVG